MPAPAARDARSRPRPRLPGESAVVRVQLTRWYLRLCDEAAKPEPGKAVPPERRSWFGRLFRSS